MLQDTLIAIELSAEEIEFARHYLERTGEEFVQASSGLTPEQWTFKPNSESWSIAEIVEHHVLTERAIHGIIQRLDVAAEPDAGWNPAEMDRAIPVRVPDRSRRGKAPEFLQPKGRWTADELLREFQAARRHTVELLNRSGLRGHVIPHSFFGPWDGYHWILAAGAHGARHVGQIAELKSAPGFPR